MCRIVSKNGGYRLRLGWFGWFSHNCVPIIILLLSYHFLFNVPRYPTGNVSYVVVVVVTVLLVIAVAGFIIQNRRLRFRSFELRVDAGEFEKIARKLLIEEGWNIEHDDHEYMRATYRRGPLSYIEFDLLTIKHTHGKIYWNVVYFPGIRTSLIDLFEQIRKGYKVMAQIRKATEIIN